jgi:DNA-binding response OmpR family regulator
MAKLGTKILIIDYEPRGIKQLSDPLEQAGYDLFLAKDGVAGLKAFEEYKPDLVLVEAMLPKRHGFEVCQEIKRSEQGRHTPVVIVTSVYKGRKYRSQAIHQYGSNEYLEKPITPEKLLETVTMLLGDRARHPPPPAPLPQAAPPPKPAAPSAPRVPAAGAVAAAGVVRNVRPEPSGDAAEAEISERLDEILGGSLNGRGGPGSG